MTRRETSRLPGREIPGESRPDGWGVDRRRFLRLAAALPAAGAGVLGEGCAIDDGAPLPSPTPDPSPSPSPLGRPVPQVNGGINVQPVRRLDQDPNEGEPVIVPDLVALQLRAVYALGFDGMRITTPFGDRANFLAAIPYVRAARAVGIDAVVVLHDFAGSTLAQALYDPARRPDVLRLYASVFAVPPPPAAPGLPGLGPRGAGRIAFQVLNEPVHFLGIPADVYVRDFLSPCYAELKAESPNVIVVSAAEVGNVDGAGRMRSMLEAGLEGACDRIAYHVYSRQAIPLLSGNVRGLVWVTESGAVGTAQHLPWVRDTFPEIAAGIPDVSRIFYYQLFDRDPGVHRLLDIQPSGSGYRAVVESTALHAWFEGHVREAAAGGLLLSFDDLVPDVRAYFPTESDRRAYDSVARS